MDADIKYERMVALREKWTECERCTLCDPPGRTRLNVVFGSGNVDADLVIIGEAAGDKEDRTGEPFAGRAGELFDKFMETFNIHRSEVFILNLVGCRPTKADDPNKNRAPLKDEIAACLPRVHAILDIVDPLVILLLGNYAMKALTKEKRGITTIARHPHKPRLEVTTPGRFIPVTRVGYATFHPSYLLRNGDMHEGSDMHHAFLCWQKAIKTVDTYKQLYFGEPLPLRGDTNE